ncbi:hypothetical protein LC612_25470 [Nostoc sp. CHAB 5834]|nr:hypothetical protein [Nostoc sp. CHAB 5834]
MQLSAVTKHLYKLVSFIPKLQHQHSKVQSSQESAGTPLPSVHGGYAIALLTAAIGGI